MRSLRYVWLLRRGAKSEGGAQEQMSSSLVCSLCAEPEKQAGGDKGPTLEVGSGRNLSYLIVVLSVPPEICRSDLGKGKGNPDVRSSSG